MRAFYRFLAPLPEAGLPSGVVLFQDEAFVWVLGEAEKCPDLEAAGGQFRGNRLSELTPDDRAACADPDTDDPRTIFAGDALEDYQ